MAGCRGMERRDGEMQGWRMGRGRLRKQSAAVRLLQEHLGCLG